MKNKRNKTANLQKQMEKNKKLKSKYKNLMR